MCCQLMMPVMCSNTNLHAILKNPFHKAATCCQCRDTLHTNRHACSPVALVFMQQTGVLGHRDWTRTTLLRGDDEEYTLATRGRMMERLQVILAGRAAEEVAFDMPTTYSISDLKVSKPCSAVLTPTSLLLQKCCLTCLLLIVLPICNK